MRYKWNACSAISEAELIENSESTEKPKCRDLPFVPLAARSRSCVLSLPFLVLKFWGWAVGELKNLALLTIR